MKSPLFIQRSAWVCCFSLVLALWVESDRALAGETTTTTPSLLCHITNGQFDECPGGTEWSDVPSIFNPAAGSYLYANQADLSKLNGPQGPWDTFMLMYDETGMTVPLGPDEYFLVNFEVVENGELEQYAIHIFTDGTIIFIEDGVVERDAKGNSRVQEIAGQRGKVGFGPSPNSASPHVIVEFEIGLTAAQQLPGGGGAGLQGGNYSPHPIFWSSNPPPPIGCCRRKDDSGGITVICDIVEKCKKDGGTIVGPCLPSQFLKPCEPGIDLVCCELRSSVRVCLLPDRCEKLGGIDLGPCPAGAAEGDLCGQEDLVCCINFGLAGAPVCTPVIECQEPLGPCPAGALPGDLCEEPVCCFLPDNSVTCLPMSECQERDGVLGDPCPAGVAVRESCTVCCDVGAANAPICVFTLECDQPLGPCPPGTPVDKPCPDVMVPVPPVVVVPPGLAPVNVVGVVAAGGGAGDPPSPDADMDTVPDEEDNCPFIANLDQEDENRNGIGDACEVAGASHSSAAILQALLSGNTFVDPLPPELTEEPSLLERLILIINFECDPLPKGETAVECCAQVGRELLTGLSELLTTEEANSLIGGVCLPPFIRGDCDQNSVVVGQVGDTVFQLAWSFLGSPPPNCFMACDANGDGIIAGDVGDAVYALNYSFLAGPPLAPPFPGCGPATLPSDIELGCEEPPKCP